MENNYSTGHFHPGNELVWLVIVVRSSVSEYKCVEILGIDGYRVRMWLEVDADISLKLDQ